MERWKPNKSKHRQARLPGEKSLGEKPLMAVDEINRRFSSSWAHNNRLIRQQFCCSQDAMNMDAAELRCITKSNRYIPIIRIKFNYQLMKASSSERAREHLSARISPSVPLPPPLEGEDNNDDGDDDRRKRDWWNIINLIYAIIKCHYNLIWMCAGATAAHRRWRCD